MEVGVVRGVADGRRDDLALGQRGTVMHRDDADHVVGILDDHRFEAAAALDQLRHCRKERRVVRVQRDRVIALRGQHDELREIERIGALAQDLALRAFLTAIFEKGARLLEVVGVDVGGERLCRSEGNAVAREDIADLTLRDRHQRLAMHAILERHEEMIAAAQHLRLKAGLAVERDQSIPDRAAQTPQFFQNAELIVRDVTDGAADLQKEREKRQCDKNQENRQIKRKGIDNRR